MSKSVVIRPVRNARDRRSFVAVPFRLFREDPDWVPPLRMAVQDRISPGHPAAAHQQTALWTAERDGRPVGRIGACVDRMFNDFQGLGWAWVGFFECIDDPEVARALFDPAWEWAASKGADTCVGPASFTTNDECGLLVEGLDDPPTVLTPHNPPYYEKLWTAAGWEPATDLWAWQFQRSEPPVLSDRQQAVLDRLRKRADLRVRDANMKDFDAEVGRFFEIYHAAWARNWGFAPMTEAEVRHLARDLKRIIDPRFALFVERGSGETVAGALALPDVNEAMRAVRNGRLLPLGWWRLLRGVPRATRARVLLLGIKPEQQTLALGPLLYSEIVRRIYAEPRIRTVEASWVLAGNHRMNSALEAMGGTRSKTWRMYERRVRS